jgi:hypothetical protein
MLRIEADGQGHYAKHSHESRHNNRSLQNSRRSHALRPVSHADHPALSEKEQENQPAIERRDQEDDSTDDVQAIGLAQLIGRKRVVSYGVSRLRYGRARR